ncbi:MAG: hypothetical protein BRC58_10575 [Cyanobacteria bacterium QS_8_64_29]|nr:MAG: hypothetical protein BRC58_10575 [Cyanobacteria bacterium QS_8_64_29]
MSTTVSILAEIPEDLYHSLQNYLEAQPNWDQNRVFAAALSLFLLQNGNRQAGQTAENYRACAETYLEALFREGN